MWAGADWAVKPLEFETRLQTLIDDGDRMRPPFIEVRRWAADPYKCGMELMLKLSMEFRRWATEGKVCGKEPRLDPSSEM